MQKILHLCCVYSIIMLFITACSSRSDTSLVVPEQKKPQSPSENTIRGELTNIKAYGRFMIQCENERYEMDNVIFAPMNYSLGWGEEDFKYSTTITAIDKKSPDEFDIHFFSQHQDFRTLSPGEYTVNPLEMYDNDLYIGIKFSPKSNIYYQMNSGIVWLKQVEHIHHGLQLVGSFSGTAKKYDLDKRKLVGIESFSGNFEFVAKDEAFHTLCYPKQPEF
ncbi:MAG: hypothetical protein MK212_06285 [Saprospiraceae bacterium]|nr:hypothetical protein [Saprospiraceae bacterium]